MKTIKNLLLFSSLLISPLSINASDTGLINFNLGKSPVSDSPVQTVTLFGCNETINADLFWDTDNQIIGDIPYGQRKSESGTDYRVSKYYIASPPAFRKGSKPNSKQQQPFIGLVTPDKFTFQGEKPAQIVYFDYRILKPTYLTFVEADYTQKNSDGDSCAELGVDLIPVNTQCTNFPWGNGALGASGVGKITSESKGVFLPMLEKNAKPLQCDVTILDDIILDHDIHFIGTDKQKTKTISLTNYHNKKLDMKLSCYKRPKNVIPTGCK